MVIVTTNIFPKGLSGPLAYGFKIILIVKPGKIKPSKHQGEIHCVYMKAIEIEFTQNMNAQH